MISTILVAMAASAMPIVAVLDHNGSEITAAVSAETGAIELRYETPRPGLDKAGVTPGTVLASGSIDEGRIRAIARAFKKGCAPATYPVRGNVDGSGTLVLTGSGPVWNKTPGSCGWRLSPDSPHGVLVFHASPADLAALMPAQTEEEPVTAVEIHAPVETPAPPVAATSVRNDPLSPVVAAEAIAEEDEMTEDQIEEARFERSIYPVPGHYTGPPIEGVQPAPEVAPAPAPAPTPEPVKKKVLELDF